MSGYNRGDRRGSLLRRLVIIDFVLLVAVLAVIFIYLDYTKKHANTDTASAVSDVQVVEISGNGGAPADASSDPSGGGTGTAADPSAGESAAPADTVSPEDPAAQPVPEIPAQPETVVPTDLPYVNEALDRAAYLAAGYDYDGAIAVLSDAAASGPEAAAAVEGVIASYTQQKEACVAVDPENVPHIFYHSLINDTNRAFNTAVLGQSTVDGFNAWMTTVEEFDKITQRLYDNGYVYVRLRDLVVETKDEYGESHFTPNYNLMLPPGKKAIVLSVDDLSYYHSYEKPGYPDHLVLDENGLVKCEYTDADGVTTIGDYDVVPRLNTFLRAHPDGAYHGARGIIALTGYDGVFGYRTDADYELRENLQSDQAEWLAEHPDFDRQWEIEQATVIANAIKAEGWEFASHTWGHLSVTQHSASTLAGDNRRWVENVQNIVGPTDTIIFAHGNDLGGAGDYTWDNDKFAMYKDAGYNFYCNVDGSHPAWIQIRDYYVRQARINLDGFMLWRALNGETHVLDGLIGSVDDIFDSRRPTPVNAFGQD